MGKRIKDGIIKARLRKVKDDDLKEKLELLPASIDTSDIIRDALRVYLSIENEKQPARTKPEPVALDTSNIQLEQKEKTHEELESEFNSLLDNL